MIQTTSAKLVNLRRLQREAATLAEYREYETIIRVLVREYLQRKGRHHE